MISTRRRVNAAVALITVACVAGAATPSTASTRTTFTRRANKICSDFYRTVLGSLSGPPAGTLKPTFVQQRELGVANLTRIGRLSLAADDKLARLHPPQSDVNAFHAALASDRRGGQLTLKFARELHTVSSMAEARRASKRYDSAYTGAEQTWNAFVRRAHLTACGATPPANR